MILNIINNIMEVVTVKYNNYYYDMNNDSNDDTSDSDASEWG